MKLNNDERLAFKKTILEIINDLDILLLLKEDITKFNDIGKQCEAQHPTHNHSYYFEIYNRIVQYIDADLSRDRNKLSKLITIIEESYEKEVSDSFISLLKATIGRFQNREIKVSTASLSTYFSRRTNYDTNAYYCAIDVCNNNVDRKIKELANSLGVVFVFDKIKHIFTNIVLVGANGSGKSRFSRQIARSKASTLPESIIPAQHYLGYDEFNNMENSNFSEIIQKYDSEDKIATSSHNYQIGFSNLIKLIQTDYNRCARIEQKGSIFFTKYPPYLKN